MTDSRHGGKREGAGRKALGKQKSVSVSVATPPDLLEQIDAIAAAQKKSRSSVMVDLIRKGLL